MDGVFVSGAGVGVGGGYVGLSPSCTTQSAKIYA